MIKTRFLFSGEKIDYLISAIDIIGYWSKIIMNRLKCEMKNISQKTTEKF